MLVSAVTLCILALTAYGRFERAAEGMKNREEAPKSLWDWSNPDAPKSTESKELVPFDYEGWIPGYEMCTFNLVLEDGADRCRGWGDGSDGSFQLDFTAETSSLEALQAVIEEHNLGRQNDTDVFVNGLPPGMGETL